MPKKKQDALALSTEQGVTLTDEARLKDLISGLRAPDRESVIEATEAFLSARSSAGMFYLEMGKQLAVCQDALKGKFLDYLKCLPHLSQATAYRMIWAYENAQKALPEATLKVAMEGGYKLISREKGGQFSEAYAGAVKNVTEKIGAPPADDPEKAKEWLTEVLREKRRLAVKEKPEPPTEDELRDACLRPFARALERLSEEDRPEFASKVLGTMLSLANLPRSKITPRPIPKEFKPPR